ncbi:MAG: DmsE family decaheme c-type cytochrome [Thermoanaerobaculia bacterium]
MKRDRGVLTAILALTLGAAAVSIRAAQAPAPTAGEPPPAASPAAETPACADCHDEAKAFPRNPHAHLLSLAKTGVAGEAVCATCHGETAAHVASSGEKPVSRPMRGLDGATFCLTCHDSTATHRSFRNSVHANSAAVNCLSCHSMHASEPKAARLLARMPVELCASCHPGQAASFHDKPFAHRLEGGMDCASCHDPHGKRGESALRFTRAGELPCVSCHSEKRGPFVFEHVSGVAGDCMSCHQPHGSSNPHQLIRARVDQMCLECHSTLVSSTLGSQPPSFHDLRLPRYQNCTTCHTAVHGSNRSPALLK